MKHIFFIIVGVSGSGKSTVIQKIIQDSRIAYVPSYATREPRPGEENGKPYRFVDQSEFVQWIQTGEFLEYALVHQSDYYGTKMSDVQHIISQGQYPLKEVDMQGLINIHKLGSLPRETVSLFFDVDDKTMKERILSRNPRTSQEEIDRRIHSAQQERLDAKKYCNHTIDATQQVDHVVGEVQNIINGRIQ